MSFLSAPTVLVTASVLKKWWHFIQNIVSIPDHLIVYFEIYQVYKTYLSRFSLVDIYFFHDFGCGNLI